MCYTNQAVKTILKVLVGSKAHGLDTPSSDSDYRGVFVVPTSSILSIGVGKPQQTSWIEGKDDDTSWELGHFLHLACHCNPTILETFVAPIHSTTSEGTNLRNLFHSIWSPTRVRDAFMGYGINQRKKFLEDKDARGPKYAVAYLRTLYQARELLANRSLPVDVRGTEVYTTLRKWKSWTKEQIDYGEVIGKCKEWENRVNEAYEHHMAHNPQTPDIDKVNQYLLKVRYNNW